MRQHTDKKHRPGKSGPTSALLQAPQPPQPPQTDSQPQSDAELPSPPPATPAKKSLWKRVSLRGIALQSFTALLIGFALAWVWPKLVGEEFATRGHARLYAPLAGYFYSDAARNQTSVLLIDNAALAAAGQAWPPQYAYHARLLRALARYRPRAIFLDIYFSEIRKDPSLPLLLKNLCALQAQGTRIFLGAAPSTTGDARLRPELEALQGQCFEKVALEYAPDALDRLAWSYQLENEDAHDMHGEAMPTAALALYRQLSGNKFSIKDNEMALNWGLRPAPYGLRWVTSPAKSHGHEDSKEKTSSNKNYCRQDFGLLEMAPLFLKKLLHDDAEKPLCVYHSTLYASDLATSSEHEEAVLKSLLEDKVVMVGTALSGSADRVLSPLHGRIPGVYLHAMALDNLLNFGPDYQRDVHMDEIGKSFKLFLFLLMSLLCGLIIPKAVMQVWNASRQNKTESNEEASPSSFAARLKTVIQLLNGTAPKEKEIAYPENQNKWLSKAFRQRVWRGFVHLSFQLVGILIKLSLAMIVVGLFIEAGQHIFDIGLMSSIDVVFFTFAAEWFELNEQLLKKLGMEVEHPKSNHSEEA